LIASGSKDKYIRIWKLSESTLQHDFDVLQKEIDGIQLSTKAHLLNVGNTDYSILLDAVLIGHDDWVHSVSWQPYLRFGIVRFKFR
jgi:elongator complex protein 2